MKKSINCKQPFIILFVLLAFIKCSAQTDSNWVLKFTKKGNSFTPTLTDYIPNKKGFYLYENCIYILKLKNGTVHNAFVNKIIKDSIIFTNNIDYRFFLDSCEKITQTISPNEIKFIKMTDHFIIDYLFSKRLKKYEFSFTNKNLPKRFPLDTIIEQEIKYVLIKKANSIGVTNERIFIENFHKYEPYIATKIDSSKFKTRNFVWLSPMHAKEINGIAIGVATGNSMFSEMPVKINGLNLNVDFITGLAGMMFTPYTFYEMSVKRFNDSLENEGSNTINGISLSAGGVVEGSKFNGIFINGGLCESYKANGIFVSGVRNIFQNIRGISVSALRNDAYECKGIQIALINNCKHLKGLQIGLWNVNNKRKLPFINWGT
jgi:hypothetical protein